MPANTPNRGYPYSIPTDPADVPQALQDLAESIDADLFNLDTVVAPRPFCQVRGTSFQSIPSNSQTTLAFDFVDYDNAGMANLGSAPTQIVPTTSGTYWVYAEILCPQQFSPTGSAIEPFQDLNIFAGGANPCRKSRNANTITGSPGLFRVVAELGGLATGVTALNTPIFLTFEHNAPTPLLITTVKMGAIRTGN